MKTTYLSLLFAAISISSMNAQDESISARNKLINSQDRRLITGINFQTENDVFAGLFGLKNKDKDYSGGFKFEFYTGFLNQGIFPMFRNRKNPDNNLNSIYIHGMGFTPSRDYFDMDTIVPGQRPYASLLGVGWKRIAAYNRVKRDCMIFGRDYGTFENFGVVSDLFLGQIGGDFPGDFQNFLHKYVTNSKIVKGWDYQIANGGRFAFSYQLKGLMQVLDLRKAFDKDSTKGVKFLLPKLMLSAQATVGNIFFNGGGTISFTNLNILNLTSKAPMNSNGFRQFTGKSPGESKDYYPNFLSHFGYELYSKWYFVRRNSLLMGLPYYDNSPYKLSRDQISNVVFDNGARITYTYNPDGKKSKINRRTTTAYFELIYRSKEFEFGDSHYFGNIGVCIFFYK